MKLFESRNVLDRIETAWNRSFSQEWKVGILPQILIVFIGGILLIISCLPIFFFFPGLLTSTLMNDMEELFSMGILLIAGILPITIATFIGGIFQTYTLSFIHNYTTGKKWTYYARLAWARLWGWAWYGFWVTLIIGVLIGAGFIAYIFLPTIASWSTLLVLGCILLWSIIPIYTGGPGYILENSWNPKSFFHVFSLTHARWWRLFGNMILGSLAVSFGLTYIKQALYGLMGIYKILENMDGTNFIELLTPDILIRFMIGGIILIVLSALGNIFLTAFEYTIWHDVVTAKKDDQPIISTGNNGE